MSRKITQKWLDARVTFWKRALRLQDWGIKIRLRREREMSLSDCQGLCEWNIRKKLAFIEIMDPVDYDNQYFLQDIERTIVHELLHLHFAPFDRFKEGTAEEIAIEQAIDLIAGAIISVHRGVAPCL